MATGINYWQQWAQPKCTRKHNRQSLHSVHTFLLIKKWLIVSVPRVPFPNLIGQQAAQRQDQDNCRQGWQSSVPETAYSWGGRRRKGGGEEGGGEGGGRRREGQKERGESEREREREIYILLNETPASETPGHMISSKSSNDHV